MTCRHVVVFVVVLQVVLLVVLMVVVSCFALGCDVLRHVPGKPCE